MQKVPPLIHALLVLGQASGEQFRQGVYPVLKRFASGAWVNRLWPFIVGHLFDYLTFRIVCAWWDALADGQTHSHKYPQYVCRKGVIFAVGFQHARRAGPPLKTVQCKMMKSMRNAPKAYQDWLNSVSGCCTLHIIQMRLNNNGAQQQMNFVVRSGPRPFNMQTYLYIVPNIVCHLPATFAICLPDSTTVPPPHRVSSTCPTLFRTPCSESVEQTEAGKRH